MVLCSFTAAKIAYLLHTAVFLHKTSKLTKKRAKKALKRRKKPKMTALELIRFLRDERERQGRTKKEICGLMMEDGYTLYEATLCNYENKKVEPSLTRFCIWARTLGYEVTLTRTEGKNG